MLINIYKITNILSRLNIGIPETSWKEEIVRFLTESTSERVVEIPLVFKNIPSPRKKILDVGCRYSMLSVQLASLGHDVHGIDINNYKHTHPNFIFHKGDILNPNFNKNYFDVVIALSTIEHIGLGRYGDREDVEGDIKAVRQILGIIKPGGQLLITLPFGKAVKTNWFRVYNMEKIRKLLTGFKITNKYFFKEKNRSWVPTVVGDAEKIDSSKKPMAVIFVKAIKAIKG
jgi:2-polyprenyl-3-methyl-5-hydroxy-6-metoxy-1,4-benzoquinol methylase